MVKTQKKKSGRGKSKEKRAGKKQKIFKPSVLITSALPYIHGMPHLGNLVGSVLPADVYSRYTKIAGYNSIFICGSDAHGAMYEIAAEKEGVTPEQLVLNNDGKVREIFKKFLLDFTYYGITHTAENKEMVYRIFKGLDKNGYIKEETEQNAFCNKCNRFLQDRWVEGECPHCHGLARGDQCDDCGKLLSAKDILKPYCVHCRGPVEFKDTKQLYIQLQMFEPWLRKWLEEGERKSWKSIPRNITLAWLNEGLRPRTITRDSKWGFQVPRLGYENKVFFVWFDAPIAYIGITKEWSNKIGKPKEWEKWWLPKKESDVKYVQFMGKDNVPFHSIMFPSYLHGSGEKWKQVDALMACSWLLAKDIKFSKSRGAGLSMEEALEIRSVDYWRYALMSLYPETDDTEFSWDEFRRIVNEQLADNIGNLFQRTLTLVQRHSRDRITGNIRKIEPTAEDQKFLDMFYEQIQKVKDEYEKCRLRHVTDEINRLATVVNIYFNKMQPWKLNPKVLAELDRQETILHVAYSMIRDLARCIYPLTPEAAEYILKDRMEEEKITFPKTDERYYTRNHKIKQDKPRILFQKIDDKELQQIKQKFSSTENSTETKEDPFSALDLRVAQITDVKDHPNADKLYVLQIDLGSERRQLVAGIRAYYKKEELLGKKIVMIANLEPAQLRGVESQGMLLAGDDGTNVGVLHVHDAPLGIPVTAGVASVPPRQITFKDFQKVKLVVGEDGIYYGDKPLMAGTERIKIGKVGKGAVVR